MSNYIQGAEASVHEASFLHHALLVKTRVPKAYRHPELDARLRTERTRDEASLLIAARRAGVHVPVLFDVDRNSSDLWLEAIQGPSLRDQLLKDDEEIARLRFRHLGEMVAALHDAGLTHGDLTTTNLLIPEPQDCTSLVMIDFGLGQFTQQDEDHAVDIHLLEEALESTDARHETLLQAFSQGYGLDGRSHVKRRYQAIKERGRYRGTT